MPGCLEYQLGLSRTCLDVFNRYRPSLLVIQTRSPLVRRDFPLIAALGAHAWLSLTILTHSDVSTLRESLIDKLIVVFWLVTVGTPK